MKGLGFRARGSTSEHGLFLSRFQAPKRGAPSPVLCLLLLTIPTSVSDDLLRIRLLGLLIGLTIPLPRDLGENGMADFPVCRPPMMSSGLSRPINSGARLLWRIFGAVVVIELTLRDWDS
jgi:hypothetical protein